MILTLRAVSLNDQPLTGPITARFDAAGGTIGRADHSTMALPDPERFISRKQAEVVFVNGGFLIRNVGAANPILLGSRALAVGESAMLGDGEELRIGGYLLRAECSTVAQPPPAESGTGNGFLLRTHVDARPSSAPAAAPASPPASAPDSAQAWGPAPAPLPMRAPHAPVSAPVPVPVPVSVPRPMPAPAASTNPFADLLGGADDLLVPPSDPGRSTGEPAWPAAGPPSADPFADLLSPPPPPRPAFPRPSAGASPRPNDLLPPMAGVSSGSAAVAPPAVPAARLPDDFDPFAPMPPPPPARPRPATDRGAPGDDPYAALVPMPPAPGIDQQFGLAGTRAQPSAANPLRDFELGLSKPAAGAAAPWAGTDPLAMFAPVPPPGPAAPPAPTLPVPDDASGLSAAFDPPRRAGAAPMPAPMPAPAPAPAAAPALPPAADAAAALWDAFCSGAGIRLPMPADPAQAAARLRQAGQVLRAAVEGTRELMDVRATTKYEMRAAVTQIHAQGNNPMKFAPDTRAGIEQLIQPAVGGFLEGPAAMNDAMRDLVGHSIGAVAGMRAAIEGLLDRFDPATLDGVLGSGSLLDNLLPANRRSRLWELYLQRFRALREAAHEDFDATFGKAFLAAYEQQVERLRKRHTQGVAGDDSGAG